MKQLFTIIFLCWSYFGLAQTNGSITGRIVDENSEPVENMSVSLTGIKGGTVTNQDGLFSFKNIGAGSYSIEVSGVGFSASKQHIQVSAGKATSLSLQLTKATNTLQDVIVNANLRRKSYNASASSNSKIPVVLNALPQSMQVVTRSLMDDQQAFNFKDVVKNVTGVNVMSSTNDFIMRGYVNGGGSASGSAELINGMRNFFVGYTNDLNLTNIDRVEILKGPSSVLFGQNSPGGSINAITKKPLGFERYTLGASFGTWGRYRFDADLSGLLSKDKKFQYRFNAAYQSDPDYRTFVYRKNMIMAPAFRYKTDKTTIDFEYVHNQIDKSFWYDWGYTSWKGDVYAVPITYTPHEPTDGAVVKNDMISIQLEHRLLSNLSFFSNFNGSSHRIDGQGHSPDFNAVAPTADSLVSRVYRQFEENNKGTFFGNIVLPVFLTSLPLMGIEVIENKTIEMATIGISLLAGSWALGKGYYKKHHQKWPLFLFVIGIICVVSTISLINTPLAEVCLKLLGACFIVTTHAYNLKYTRRCVHNKLK